MSKSCSIFFYEGYVGVAPTIINLSKSLNECGYSVTIYGTKNSFPDPGEIGNKTTLVYFLKVVDLPWIINLTKTIIKYFKKPLTYKLFIILDEKLNFKAWLQVIEVIFFIVNYLVKILKTKKNINLNTDISIGVDTNGSILALLKFWLFNNQFLYLSLELNHPSLFKKCAKMLPMLEQISYRKSAAILVQDEDRFKTLCEYNQYQHPNVFYIPNSTKSSSPLTDETKSPNYFRELFNLSFEEFPYIILQAGMIQDYVFAKELAKAFSSIDKGFALVFHDREKREIDDPYIKSLQEINSKNLFLSLNPLPYEQIECIYASATIGLAFYQNVDSNFSQISMASGKLSHYLKHGSPVLVNDLKSLSTLVNKYQIGIVIKDPLNSVEIESALERILSNYSFYSQNAKICFDKEFDFDKKVQPVLNFIATL